MSYGRHPYYIWDGLGDIRIEGYGIRVMMAMISPE